MNHYVAHALNGAGEKKLAKLAAPDTWKDGARNVSGGKDGGRMIGENKALTVRVHPMRKGSFEVRWAEKTGIGTTRCRFADGQAFPERIHEQVHGLQDDSPPAGHLLPDLRLLKGSAVGRSRLVPLLTDDGDDFAWSSQGDAINHRRLCIRVPSGRLSQ